MIKNIILSIFIFLIIFINFNSYNSIVESFIIKDITIANQYYKKLLGLGNQCIFQFTIYCEPSNESESCDQLIYYSNSETLNISFLKINNGTKYIHTLTVTSNVGKFLINFNSNLLLDFECIDYDLSKIDFKLISNGYFYFPKEDGDLQVYGLYEMTGLNSTIDPHIVSLRDITPTSDDGVFKLTNIENSNKFLFTIESVLKSNYNYLSPSVAISKELKKYFNLEPIFKDTYDDIFNIKSFPDEQYINGLTLMGIGSAPIIQFTSNNTIYKSPFLINRDLLNPIIQYFPIYGTNSTTTYLLSTFISVSSYGITNSFDIYKAKGGLFELSKSFETTLLYTISIIPSLTSQYPVLGEIPIASFFFSVSQKYNLGKIKIELGAFSYSSMVPYGLKVSDPLVGYNFGFDVLCKPWYFSPQSIGVSNSGVINVNYIPNSDKTFTYNQDFKPSVLKVETIHLVKESYLLKLYIKCPYDLYYIDAGGLIFYNKESLVSGDLKDGVYHIVIPIIIEMSISIYDIYGGSTNINTGSVLSFSPIDIFINPIFVQKFDINTINQVRFLYQDIDVTDFRHYNVLYFNFTDPFPKDISILMVPAYSISEPRGLYSYDDFFYSTYNENLKLFQIEFYIEANSPIGEYSFHLLAYDKKIYSSTLPKKLIIKNSNVDLQGPVFKEIRKSNVYIDDVNKYGEIGWSIKIEDSINGFSHGFVTVISDVDQSVYNFSISLDNVKSGGNKYIGEYDFKFNISNPCKSQNYIITDIELYDTRNRVSYFSIDPINPTLTSVLNPFIHFLNDSTINKILVSCSTSNAASNDISQATLNQFIMSTTTIDVSKTIREIMFNVTIEDLNSAIKNDQNPIIYLQTTNQRTVKCPTTLYEGGLPMTKSSFSTICKIPFNFGYPDGIIVNVFGIRNNNGFISGYPSSILKDIGRDYYITTLFNTNEPVITDYLRIDERGGDLWLIGRGFDNLTRAYIEFNDSILSSDVNILGCEVISFNTLKVPNVKATEYPYKVYIKTSQYTSNEIIVKPSIIGYNNRPPATLAPSSTPTSTPTPLPTNAPKSCPGKPVCGGPSNGKCIENQGCVCFSPWIGLDCLSQIIIIDQPKSNDTTPSTEIIIDNNNNHGGSNNNEIPISYRSIISLVALREIDINGKFIVEKYFDKWIAEKQKDNSTIIYKTSLQVNQKEINVKATLQWYKNQTTIEFANEKLIMNPSTMKYTIEIDRYPFRSQLSNLELVMSAYFESNNTDNSICSVKEFGETTQGDNSNYIKVQVSDHSLYGRFIRRGIIDSTIRSITNIQLDKDMNPITKTKQLQSFIGIQIPYYENSIIIDPDFSVLIDSYSASSKSNSICSNKSLTSGKIAGIIIGCVAFVAVVVASISYYFIKKKRAAKFISNVNLKMKQMNNNKL